MIVLHKILSGKFLVRAKEKMYKCKKSDKFMVVITKMHIFTP